VKFYLTSLQLDGEAISFHQAWVAWQQAGPGWEAFVTGSHAPNGKRLRGDLILLAQASDGTRLDGMARLESRDALSGELELRGTGPLFVDGRRLG
jgi:hypothetical protein